VPASSLLRMLSRAARRGRTVVGRVNYPDGRWTGQIATQPVTFELRSVREGPGPLSSDTPWEAGPTKSVCSMPLQTGSYAVPDTQCSIP
jgi:hypothetical protein